LLAFRPWIEASVKEVIRGVTFQFDSGFDNSPPQSWLSDGVASALFTPVASYWSGYAASFLRWRSLRAEVSNNPSKVTTPISLKSHRCAVSPLESGTFGHVLCNAAHHVSDTHRTVARIPLHDLDYYFQLRFESPIHLTSQLLFLFAP
jgi:hypothetical protein